MLIANNKLLLIGGDQNRVQAIDVATRKLLWQIPLKTDLFYTLKTYKNLLFNSEENFKAYDLATGKQKWENTHCQSRCYTEISGEDVFQISNDEIFRVDPTDGAVKWSFRRHGELRFIGSNAASIFLAFNNGNQKTFYNFDKKSGKIKWEIEAEERDDASYAVGADRLYVSFLNSQRILALDTTTGKKVWDYATETERFSGINFDAPTFDQNRVYCGSSDGFLYIFDKTTGKSVNQIKFSDSDVSSPLIVGNFGYLAENNNIHKINLVSGESLWKFSSFGAVESLAYETGTLYFEGREHSYNALDLAKTEKAARLKRPLGTRSPKKDLIKKQSLTMTMGSGTAGEFPKQEQAISEAEIYGEKLYFSITNQISEQGILYEIDLASGSKKIVAPIKSLNLSSPTIDRGIAYLYDLPLNVYGKGGSTLFAVNLADGQIKWRRDAPFIFSAKPQIVGDIIYAAHNEKQASRYDLAGNRLDQLSADATLLRDKFVFGDNRRLFFKFDAQTFVALDLQSRKPAWYFEKPNQWISAFAEAPDAALLLAVSHDGIYKIERETGKTLWRSSFPDETFNEIKAKDGKIFAVSQYFVSGFTWVQAIDAASGKVVWEKTVGSLYDPKSVFLDDKICFNLNSSIVCYDYKSGSKTDAFSFNDNFLGLSENGILVSLIKNEKTEKATAVEAVNIKTNQKLWRIDL